MRQAIFKVIVNYESNNYMIKAEDHAFDRFNFIGNSLSAVVVRQYKITRDLAKQNIKALFEYTN